MNLGRKASRKFEIRGNRIYSIKLGCLIEFVHKIDDISFIYLDDRFAKDVSLLVEDMIDQNIKFYLISPKFKNPKFPKFDEDFHNENLKNFIYSLRLKEFHLLFHQIGFDPLSNLINYMKEFDLSDEMVKDHIEISQRYVSKSYNDWFSRKEEYDYDIDIRNYFANLWRSIKLQRLIG